MISYHPDTNSIGQVERYARGFAAVDTVDLVRIARCMTGYVWSHCVWRDGHRRQANFIAADFLGLDFDGTMPLAQALRSFSDSAHVIGTTRNHQQPKGDAPPLDRFRVLLKLENRITNLATIRATSRHYIERWDADGQCHDGARLFFPCREIVSVNPDGEAWEVVEASPDQTEPVPEAVDGELSAFAIWFLKTNLPVGSRNDSCHRFAKDLIRAAFTTEQVFQMICTSPTYREMPMPADLKDEIRQAIASAARAVREERHHAS